MSHIFISYSKQNIDFARHLRRLLQDQGFAVWMDETQLGASEKWWASIETNIIDCSAFIIIMSPASKTSDWVEREILVAEDPDYKKPVFPVLLDGKVWSRLANIQYEDMRTGIDATLTAGFVQRLAKIVPRGNAAVAPPPLPGTVLPPTPTKGGLLAHPNWQGIGAIVGIIGVLVAVAIYVASINQPSTIASALTLTAAQIAVISSDTPSPTDTPTTITDTPAPSNTPTPTIVARPSTTATVVIDMGMTATEAILQRTADAQQAINAALIAENTQIAQTAAARAIPTATIQVSPTVAINLPASNLRLITDQDVLTLYIASSTPISLKGLQFGFTNSTSTQLIDLTQRFDQLKLTDGFAQPGACYIFTLANSNGIIPAACSNVSQIFRLEVPRADRFWYDTITNRLRDIAIFQNSLPTEYICSATQVECEINWP